MKLLNITLSLYIVSALLSQLSIKTNASSVTVCGEGSLCKGKLHRPLCYCPKGYEGNPHEICNKVYIYTPRIIFPTITIYIYI